MDYYLNQLTEADKELANKHIFVERDILRHVYLSCIERAIKALSLLNSGGIVTILAYGYKDGNLSFSKMSFFSSSLCVFLLGLVITFILIAYDYFDLRKKFTQFNANVSSFYKNEIVFSSIDHCVVPVSKI